MSKMQNSASNVKQVLFISILILFLLFGLASKFSMALYKGLNSDHVVQAIYFWDIVENKNCFLSDWYLSTNSFIFTEFPVYLINGLIMGMSLFTVKVSAFLIFVIGMLILSIVVYKVYDAKSSLFCGAIFSCSSLFGSYFLIQPTLHIGTVNISLLSLLIVILIVEKDFTGAQETIWAKRKIIYYFLFFLISVLSVFSDRYYIFIFSIPLVVSLISIRFIKIRLMGVRETVILISLCVSAVITGLVLQQTSSIFGIHMVEHSDVNIISFGMIWQKLVLYLKTASEMLNINFVFPLAPTIPESMSYLLAAINPDVFIIKLCNLFLVALMIFSIYQIFRKEGNALKKFIILYFVTLVVLLSLAFISSSQTAYIAHTRYLTPLLYVFAFFLSLSVAGNNKTVKPVLRHIAIGLFLISAVHNIYNCFNFRQEQRYLQLASFLERENLLYGYSGYWRSNIVTAASGNRVKVRAIKYEKGNIEPLLLASKSDWYDPAVQKGRTFLMIPTNSMTEFGLAGLNQDNIKKIFGEPERILNFKEKNLSMDIYVWKYNITKRSLQGSY